MTEAPGTALPENGRQREDIGPLIEEFTQTDGTYYRRTFERIGGSPRFVWIFHPWAALLGPVWYGARGLWNAAIPFLLVETFAFIQMARGLFGNLATDAYARVAQVEATLALRKKQLEAARAANADNVDVFERTVKSLEAAIGGIRREAAEIEQGAIWVALSGVAMLLLFKAAEGFWANRALEKRFSEWLSNRKIASGVTLRRTLL
ncbi:MAG: glycine/betaine ABC transporter, partial [Rhodospirillaceae bacterium]|nr:glycine/betaine ABC transporter [Rhodospirillaceae bacterium]